MQSDDGLDIGARHRKVLALNLGFWIIIGILLSIRAVLTGVDHTPALIAVRLVNISVGMTSCLLIWYLMERLERWSFWQRALLGGCLTILGAFIFTLSTNYSPRLFMSREAAMAIDATFIQAVPVGGNFISLRRMGLEALEWLPLFFAWGGLAFGLLYSFEVQDRERQVQHLNALSHEAQLRAMRYQVDPHFLFNALNSISAAVLDQKNDVAENMLMRLSSYYRRTLALDPTADIALKDELEFQRHYISVEQLRFGSRLRFETDIPDALRTVKVPSFILQPLLENAVKHGVAGRPDRETLVRVEARGDEAWLHLTVSNNGGSPASRAEQSTGTGLRNVRERLRLRFGDHHGFTVEQREHGFVVRLMLPLDIRHFAAAAA